MSWWGRPSPPTKVKGPGRPDVSSYWWVEVTVVSDALKPPPTPPDQETTNERQGVLVTDAQFFHLVYVGVYFLSTRHERARSRRWREVFFLSKRITLVLNSRKRKNTVVSPF